MEGESCGLLLLLLPALAARVEDAQRSAHRAISVESMMMCAAAGARPAVCVYTPHISLRHGVQPLKGLRTERNWLLTEGSVKQLAGPHNQNRKLHLTSLQTGTEGGEGSRN